jgi:hypothetical protein
VREQLTINGKPFIAKHASVGEGGDPASAPSLTFKEKGHQLLDTIAKEVLKNPY